MGCPPDPMEIGMYKDRDKITALNQQYDELINSCLEHLSLLQKLQKLLKAPDQNTNVENFIKEITPLLSPQTFNRDIPAYDPNDPYRDVSEMSSKRSTAETLTKEAENIECRIMHFITQVVLPQIKSDSIPSIIKTILPGLQEKYALHRKDDLNTWTKWLQERKDTLYYSMKRSEKVHKERYQDAIKKIETELERVKKIKKEELLANRDLFGRNPEDFEPRYD